jgi:hypothetical protein
MREPMHRKSPHQSAALTGLKVVASLVFLSSVLLAADPVVSNVQGLQRRATKLVTWSEELTPPWTRVAREATAEQLGTNHSV